jgi:hypothetical protein
VLIQSRIVNDVENKRHFLLVAQGAAADTTYTVNLDGVAVGSVTASKNGKLMVKSLDGDFRIAGTHLLTITDGTSNVIAQADFFRQSNNFTHQLPKIRERLSLAAPFSWRHQCDSSIPVCADRIRLLNGATNPRFFAAETNSQNSRPSSPKLALRHLQ